MRKLDELIIYLLIVLFGLITWICIWTDKEIDAMNKTIQLIQAQTAINNGKISQVIADNAVQDERLDDIEHHDKVQDIRIAMCHDELTNTAELFTDLLDDLGALEKVVNSMPKNTIGVKVTEKDIRDIAALVYLEAGAQSYKCQKAIASVIFNRMIKYHKTASQVIYEDGVFSPASKVSRTTPSGSCMKAVKDVLANGLTLPKNVVAFRNRRYHSFGKPYVAIDNVYFSWV